MKLRAEGNAVIFEWMKETPWGGVLTHLLRKTSPKLRESYKRLRRKNPNQTERGGGHFEFPRSRGKLVGLCGQKKQ